MWPKYGSSVTPKRHFSVAQRSPYSCNRSRIRRRCTRCSLWSLENIMISSKYTCANFPRWPSNARVMSFWNVAGAFFSPNGITRYWYVAPSGVANAVRCFDALSIGICQYPDFKSMAENTVADPNSRSASLIFGNGAASSSVRRFSFR
jgi:hypothetical protein